MPDRPPDDQAAHPLATDHLRHDLVGRSVRGGIVTIGAQGAKVIVQFLAVVLLARLLAPADFGVFAMVAAFLGILEVLKDLGLSTATIQRATVTPQQVSTLFWLNVGLGAAVAVGLAAAAPGLAWFYGQPVLRDIVPVVALAFLFNGFGTQHLAILRRQMRFSAIALVLVGGEMAALCAAVAAAVAGLGLWALVIQRLVWAVVTTAGAWMASGWRPTRPAPLAEVRGMIAFGGNATASMVIGHVASNLDKVMIGWWWGAVPLGFFERAQKLLQLPIQNLNTPLATVALPALSRLADQPARYRDAYLAGATRLAMLVAPLGGLFIAAGDLVVGVVLGPQWMDAAPILRWMGIAATYMPLTYTLSWLYMSQDRTSEMLRASLVNSTLTVLALLAGLPFGAVGVAAAYALSGALLRVPLLFWLVGRRGPVRARDMASVLLLPASAVLAVAGAGTAARALLPLDGLPGAVALAAVLAVSAGAVLAVYGASPRGRRIARETARQIRVSVRGEAPA